MLYLLGGMNCKKHCKVTAGYRFLPLISNTLPDALRVLTPHSRRWSSQFDTPSESSSKSSRVSRNRSIFVNISLVIPNVILTALRSYLSSMFLIIPTTSVCKFLKFLINICFVDTRV